MALNLDFKKDPMSPENANKMISAINYTTLTDNKLLSENGYQKLPSGLILQWGTATATLSATEITKAVTFPVAFPNTCFLVNATLRDVGPQSTQLTSNIGYGEISKTAATFKIKSNSNYINGANINFKWLAIGY